MIERDESPAEERTATTSTGRHGGGSGLSAAELIARSRAALGDTAQRPSRSARRAAAEETSPPEGRPAAPPQSSPAAPPQGSPAAVTGAPPGVSPSQAAGTTPPARNLRALQALRAEATPPSGAVALASQPRSAQALATPVLDPPAAAEIETATPANDERTAGPAPATPIDLPEIAKPRKSRAGRNLPAAIGVGVGLAAIIISTLAIYRPSFVVLVGIAVAIGVYEMVTAVGTVGVRPPLVPLLAGVLAMQAAAWVHGPDGLVGALLLTVLGLTIWRLADGATGYLRDVATANLVALYIPFLAGFATLLAHADDGAARIVLFILTVVCSDTGGYAVGALFGKHPMAPTVSPKKSWEGFAGSLVAGGLEGVLMLVFCFHQQWWQGALFGIAVVITATLGDLGESMIKRDLGLKDMGKLLPGHGGIMDRLDSLLPCAPVAYLLLAAFLPG
jgi:phosphatidate cytidylyltransferase